jgi:hypothetical protein
MSQFSPLPKINSYLIWEMRVFIGFLVIVLLSSCSNLPIPGAISANRSSGNAEAVLRESALRHGDPWKHHQRVQVNYEGEWTMIATQVQPILTDKGFRKSSVETYQPRIGKIRQLHSGPQGEKEVIRQRPQSTVTFNGTRSTNPEVKDAAALVADAYTVFLFGSSWLIANGSDFRLLDDRSLDGENCRLVAGRLSPGLGVAKEDYFIAWIGDKSKLMKRFQFSLNGMESTRGADVDVTFSEHWKSSEGSTWPGHFLEYIQRPILAKAHDWRMTSLSIDGKKMR